MIISVKHLKSLVDPTLSYPRSITFLKRNENKAFVSHRMDKPAFAKYIKETAYWPNGMFILQYWENSHWLNTKYKSNLNNNN